MKTTAQKQYEKAMQVISQGNKECQAYCNYWYWQQQSLFELNVGGFKCSFGVSHAGYRKFCTLTYLL